MMSQPELSAGAVRAWDRPVVTVPVLAFVALVGGLFGSFTSAAYLLVIAVGAAMMWLGLSGWVGRRPSPTRLTRQAAWWLAPVLLLAAVELVGFSRHSISDYPTLSLLADPVLEHYLPRAAGYLAWLAGFWVLVRR